MELILSIVQPLLEQVGPLLIGFVTLFLVQQAKKIEAIPVNDGQKARLRLVASGLSIGLNLFNAYLNGSLSDQALYQPLVEGGYSWLISHLAYKAYLNK